MGNTHFFDKGDGGSRRRVRAINAAMARLADDRSVRFLNFSERTLRENDELNAEFYAADKLHLSARGYALWAEGMDPLIEEMLK